MCGCVRPRCAPIVAPETLRNLDLNTCPSPRSLEDLLDDFPEARVVVAVGKDLERAVAYLISVNISNGGVLKRRVKTFLQSKRAA